ncbi:DUF1559 family PulG-like putative transporter [Gimesia algae]
MGLALHNDHDNFQMFPPGDVRRTYGSGVSAVPNSNLRKEKLPAVRCPSDSSHQPDGNDGPTICLACRGTTMNTASAPVTLIFWNNSNTKIREVGDGITNTIMVSETYASAEFCTEQTTASNGVCPATCTSFNGGLTGGQQVYSWMYASLYEATYFGTAYTPNNKQPDCGASSSSQAAHLAARSKHTGGAHALLGDGSVRFASDSIDSQIWINLGNPADGNVLGEW